MQVSRKTLHFFTVSYCYFMEILALISGLSTQMKGQAGTTLATYQRVIVGQNVHKDTLFETHSSLKTACSREWNA